MSDYLAVLRRRWPWVLGAAMLGAVLALLYSTSRPVEYEATARVLLDTTAAQDAVASRLDLDTDVADRDLGNEVNLARSDTIFREVTARINADLDAIDDSNITAEPESDILIFQFRQPTSQQAALLTNTWAEVYVEHKRDVAQASIDGVVEQLEIELADLRTERGLIRQQLERLEDELVRTSEPEERDSLELRIAREESAIDAELNLVDSQITTTVESLTQMRLSRELAGAAQIVQVAAEPQEPVNAPVWRDILIGGLLGLLLGAGLALLRDGVDQSIRSSEDVRRIGASALGDVPKAPNKLARVGMATISHTMPGSIYADSYQKVRSAVEYLSADRDIKTILITSPHEGDGKTTLAVNLATAFANTGTRVVLIDLDLRRPSIHHHFSAEMIPGFSDALQDNIPLDKLSVSTPSLASTLRILPAGTCPSDPAAFLASPKLSSVINQLRVSADVVLLDAPPVLPVADALSVASVVDGVILVVSAGQTKESDLVESIQAVRRAGGNTLGVVVNKSSKVSQGSYTPVDTNRSSDEFVPMYLSEIRGKASEKVQLGVFSSAALLDSSENQTWSTEDTDGMPTRASGAAGSADVNGSADTSGSETETSNPIPLDIADVASNGAAETIDPGANIIELNGTLKEPDGNDQDSSDDDSEYEVASRVTTEIDRSEIDRLLDEL